MPKPFNVENFGKNNFFMRHINKHDNYFSKFDITDLTRTNGEKKTDGEKKRN